MGEPCSLILSTGERAIHVYVMPKYKLQYAWENTEDMQSMIVLAKASSEKEVKEACVGKGGLYSIKQHMYLRVTYTAIYITDKNKVIDTHRHVIQGGGFSEHA